MGRGRLWAWLALLAAVGVVAALVTLIIRDYVTLTIVIAAAAVAAAAAWLALTRRGSIRPVAAVVALAALVAAMVTLSVRDAFDELLIFAAAGLVFGAATRRAIRDSRRAAAMPAVKRAPASRAVLLMNPKSGGGKVATFNLVAEAKRRGIEPIVARPGRRPRDARA
jgi:hypothetical protein